MDCKKTLRVAGVVADSIVDGAGLRYSIYTQGCPQQCEGCHNPQSWDFDGGNDMAVDDIFAAIEGNRLLDGVSFSGGEPFCHAEVLAEIAQFAKGLGLNIWIWSGWTYEELLENPVPHAVDLLELCDVLVDGRFELANRSLSLEWRGSSNQRVIDLNKSRAEGTVVPYQTPNYGSDYTIPVWG